MNFKKKKKRAGVAFLKPHNPRPSFANNINLISPLMVLKIQSKCNIGFKTQVLSPSLHPFTTTIEVHLSGTPFGEWKTAAVGDYGVDWVCRPKISSGQQRVTEQGNAIL